MAGTQDFGRRFVDAFNAHSEERLRELNHPDALFEAPGDVRIRGREAATGYAMAWLNAFPDARITVHEQIDAADHVIQRFTFEGTHAATLKAPTGDIPATRRKLTGRGIQVLKIKDGMAAETHLYFDQVQVLTQLGLMPAGTGSAG